MTPSPKPEPETGAVPAKGQPTKGQLTRERIYASAMELFASNGYEKTTMRMIADRAQVNVALSYHYFPSKEHLVFEFYRNFTRDFIERSAPVIAASAKLEARIVGVIETMFAIAEPYHSFAGSLFATAASPASPLNPFSSEFTEVRESGIELCRRVVEGCTPRVPAEVAAELPFLLWLLNLSMLYCWMHDHSVQQEKARTILRQTARLLTGLVRLSSSPGAGYFRRQLLSLSRLIRTSIPLSAPDPAGPAGSAT
jgi:AcrR family transcriptional regulator